VPSLFTSGVQPDAIRPAGAVPWVQDPQLATAVITAPAGVTAERFGDVETVIGLRLLGKAIEGSLVPVGSGVRFPHLRRPRHHKVLIFTQCAHS
jgi:hypothetical protein